MAHKYQVGDVVEYTGVGVKTAQFRVIRQMPAEFQGYDWRYRIKSDQESFARNILECDLSPSIVPEDRHGPIKPLRRPGSHH